MTNYFRFWLPLALIFLAIWLYRYQSLLPQGLEQGQKIRVRATLREEPRIYGQHQRFTLAGIKIKARRFPEYHWGDQLVATGSLKVIRWNRFYREYLLEFPEISPNLPTSLISPIFSFKSRLLNTFRQSLPEPHVSLLAGIVLGEKSALPSDFWQALKKTGTLHIVVASGANITFLAGFLMGILPLIISRRIAYLITSVLIWFYVVLTGGEAPIVRAGIMGTVAFLGMSLGKIKEAIRGLLAAAFILLLIRPLSLFDVGFQLSFGATLGIILFGSRNWGVIEKIPGVVKEAFKTTVSAQLFTTPIIILNFGSFPLLSPLVNILVYWTVPLLMGLGGMAAILGLVWQPLGRTFGFLAYPLLEYFVRVVEAF